MPNGNTPKKISILGVGISQTSYAEVVDLCAKWSAERISGIAARSAHYICVTSVHGVVMARDDRGVAEVLNQADIATPDGMPIVWALRSLGCPNQQRVYGPTLMLEICRRAAETGQRLFLYGGMESVLPELVTRLRKRFPGLVIAGSYSPPFRSLTEEEENAVRRRIVESDADVIFVGISTPKQEKWMYAHRDVFPGVTMVGVGAAFDFHAGRVRQAPNWMQRSGLEWLFRLTMEPTRLWQRYLLVTPRFLPLWAMQKWKSLHHPQA
jgi:N-acetylglucosaminyldiphosphoundecaprenol N-acetyl-beta-D-mannosaminyltransferase